MTDNIHKFSDHLEGRDERGRYVAGGSKGRPVGAKAKVSRDLLARIKAMGPDAVQKLWEALLSNERWAVELILQHCLPRDRAIAFEGTTIEDVTEALASGDVSPNEAAQLATVIAKLREIESLDDIRQRLADLEATVTDANARR